MSHFLGKAGKYRVHYISVVRTPRNDQIQFFRIDPKLTIELDPQTPATRRDEILI